MMDTAFVPKSTTSLSSLYRYTRIWLHNAFLKLDTLVFHHLFVAGGWGNAADLVLLYTRTLGRRGSSSVLYTLTQLAEGEEQKGKANEQNEDH